jgi:hypothetical protein
MNNTHKEYSTMKNIFLFLALLSLAHLLSACSSGSNCDSGIERQRGNVVTGKMGRDATIATLCVDKTDYNKGDIVHITFTVKNALDEPIVLDGGQQPAMDICFSYAPCLSHYQPDIAQLTRLELGPGQSHTIQWDWPTPEVDMSKSVEPQTNGVAVYGKWIGLDKAFGSVRVQFFYGPRRMMP